MYNVGMREALFYDLKGVSPLTTSLATQIACDLGRQIVAGSYVEGSLIDDEDDLAARYRVSRTAVRDAIKILCGKGLLYTRRGVGTQVQSHNYWAWFDNDVLAWHQSIDPNKELMFQFLDLRQMIEPQAAFWAAERASEEKIAEIEASYEAMAKPDLTTQDFVLVDAVFHQTIMRSTDNHFLGAFEGIIFSALLMSIRLTNKNPISNADSLVFHKNVSDAIAKRDKHGARERMQELLSDVHKRLDMHFQQT